jgi:hypothetical protein
MAQLGWIAGGMVAIAVLVLLMRRLGRSAGTRAAVIEEVRRTLREGTLERSSGGATQVRGRLGPLEVTVDLQSDARRPRQSPMWRVTAEGPVGLDHAIEARIAGWEGWIDPWMQLGESLSIPGTGGPPLTLHAERPPDAAHPLVTALRRQGERLGPGAIHLRHDLIRVETRSSPRLEDNRPLFAYLHVVGEMAELPPIRARAGGSTVPRYGVLPEGS